MTEQLKVTRATAKGQFTKSEKRLKDAITMMESIPVSTIERRYDELHSKWDTLQEAHEKYITALRSASSPESSIDEAAENNWIDEIADRFDAIEIETDKKFMRLQASCLQLRQSKQVKLRQLPCKIKMCQQ